MSDIGFKIVYRHKNSLSGSWSAYSPLYTEESIEFILKEIKNAEERHPTVDFKGVYSVSEICEKVLEL